MDWLGKLVRSLPQKRHVCSDDPDFASFVFWYDCFSSFIFTRHCWASLVFPFSLMALAILA